MKNTTILQLHSLVTNMANEIVRRRKDSFAGENFHKEGGDANEP